MTPKTMFMVDLETTGVDIYTDNILQIGLLKLTRNADGYWEPGESFQKQIFYGGSPKSEFARQHMAEVYRASNHTPFEPHEEVRTQIKAFIRSSLGIPEGQSVNPQNVVMCGVNASGFDLPFLEMRNFLRKMSYVTGEDGKDVAVGDYSYRVYEITGAIELVMDAYDLKNRTEVLNAANTMYTMVLPDGKKHEALYDCYNQTKTLNGLIKLLRDAVRWGSASLPKV